MSVISRKIEVSFEHQVHFTDHVFSADNPRLRNVLVPPAAGKAPNASPSKALVVLDESLATAQPDLIHTIESYFAAHAVAIQMVCPPLVIEGGERAKNSLVHVQEIHSHVERCHIDRHSYIIAIGGGALLDVAGLAAATAHRGVRLVRLPTTVLAQSDSGVGVKNGINAFGKKNFIGTFTPPFAVINDFQLLSTLPDRDRRAGCVEAVKVALIRDLPFFEQLETDASALARFDPEATRNLIRRCAELHFDHIAGGGDPFEVGSARPLDFGHWSAHKLEQISGYRIRHGEAVAIGIAIDTLYSHRIGWLDTPSMARVLALLKKLGFDLAAPELFYRDSAGEFLVMQGLQEFREHLGGALTLTLVRDLGHGVETTEIDHAALRASIEALRG